MSLHRPPTQADVGAIRSGSYGLAQQAGAWRFALMHDRPDDLLLWVTRGQGRVTVNGIRRGISMNNALYLPAGTLFSFDLSSQAQALLVESPAGRVPLLPKAPMLLRARDGRAQVELTGHIDTMTRERQMGRPLFDEALEAQMRLVAVWLHRQAEAATEPETGDSAAQRLVRRYARAVVRNYDGPHPMSAFAEALDVTPTHLSRACRSTCGRTAAEMLTERRLHAARCALEDDTAPVKEIAAGLGFASAAYFTRFIRNHAGAAPSDLRARARQRAGQG